MIFIILYKCMAIVSERLFVRTDRLAYLLKIIPRVRGFEWREKGGEKMSEQKEKPDSVFPKLRLQKANGPRLLWRVKTL